MAADPKKKIDPAMAIMGFDDDVNYDAFLSDPKQEIPAPSESEKTRSKKESTAKEKKPSQGSSERSYSTIALDRETFQKLQLSKSAYTMATKEKISMGRFIGLLIEKGLPALSPKAQKIVTLSE